MAYKKCPFLRYLVNELQSYNVHVELDYQTGEVLGVRINEKSLKDTGPKNIVDV